MTDCRCCTEFPCRVCNYRSSVQTVITKPPVTCHLPTSSDTASSRESQLIRKGVHSHDSDDRNFGESCDVQIPLRSPEFPASSKTTDNHYDYLPTSPKRQGSTCHPMSGLRVGVRDALQVPDASISFASTVVGALPEPAHPQSFDTEVLRHVSELDPTKIYLRPSAHRDCGPSQKIKNPPPSLTQNHVPDYMDGIRHWRKCRHPCCPLRPLHHPWRGETSDPPPAWKGFFYSVEQSMYVVEVAPLQWHGEQKIELGMYKLLMDAAMAYDVGAYYIGRNTQFNYGSPQCVVKSLPSNLSWDDQRHRRAIERFIQAEVSAIIQKCKTLMVSQQRLDTNCWVLERSGVLVRALQSLWRMQSIISEEVIMQLNRQQCKFLSSELSVIHVYLLETRLDTHNVFLATHELCNLLEKAERLVQECCSDQWLSVALARVQSAQELVELLLDLHWWTDILRIANSEAKESLEFCELTLKLKFADESYEVQRKILQESDLLMRQTLQDRDDLQLKLLARGRGSASSQCDTDLHSIASYLLRKLEILTANHPSPAPWKPKSLHLDLQTGFLGMGSSGFVHKVTWLGKQYALKLVPGVSDKEAAVLARYPHPHIVQLMCHWAENGNSFLLLELMDGDLAGLIAERKRTQIREGTPFLILEAIDMILQVAKALRYLHSEGVIHRDLKCKNILWKYDHQLQEIIVKLGDFGSGKEYLKNSSTDTPHSWPHGTTGWRAPELLLSPISKRKGKTYPFMADVFSFGMTCFEILTGSEPLKDISPRSEVHERLLSGFRPDLQGARIPPCLVFVVESCWATDPQTRPSFKQICRMLLHSRNVILGLTFYVDKTPFFSYSSHDGLVKQMEKQDSMWIQFLGKGSRLVKSLRKGRQLVAQRCYEAVFAAPESLLRCVLLGVIWYCLDQMAVGEHYRNAALSVQSSH